MVTFTVALYLRLRWKLFAKFTVRSKGDIHSNVSEAKHGSIPTSFAHNLAHVLLLQLGDRAALDAHQSDISTLQLHLKSDGCRAVSLWRSKTNKRKQEEIGGLTQLNVPCQIAPLV